MQNIEPITFSGLTGNENNTWQRPTSFAFVNELSYLPLSDSELLLTCHYLPIAIDYVDDALQVVALTMPRFQRSPLINLKGQWQRPYLPIALRCLPFRASPGTMAEELEMANNLDKADHPKIPIFTEDGSLSPEVEKIKALLRRLEQGKRALQKAAEKLLIAGVLTPFQMARITGTAEVCSPALTIDRNKFEALSHVRAAHLVTDGFLAVDIAAACIFSQRLLPHLISVVVDPVDKSQSALANGTDEYLTGLKAQVHVDGSELFPFELFKKMSCRHDEKD